MESCLGEGDGRMEAGRVREASIIELIAQKHVALSPPRAVLSRQSQRFRAHVDLGPRPVPELAVGIAALLPVFLGGGAQGQCILLGERSMPLRGTGLPLSCS